MISTCRNIVLRMCKRTVSFAFFSWHANVLEQIRLSVVSSRVLRKWTMRTASTALITWKLNTVEIQRQLRVISRVAARLHNLLVSGAFEAWKCNSQASAKLRKKLRATMQRWFNLRVAMVFNSWVETARHGIAFRLLTNKAMFNSERSIKTFLRQNLRAWSDEVHDTLQRHLLAEAEKDKKAACTATRALTVWQVVKEGARFLDPKNDGAMDDLWKEDLSHEDQYDQYDGGLWSPRNPSEDVYTRQVHSRANLPVLDNVRDDDIDDLMWALLLSFRRHEGVRSQRRMFSKWTQRVFSQGGFVNRRLMLSQSQGL
jgi:hypothetical protein